MDILVTCNVARIGSRELKVERSKVELFEQNKDPRYVAIESIVDKNIN